MVVLLWYRRPALNKSQQQVTLDRLQSAVTKDWPITGLDTELCFYVELQGPVKELSAEDEEKLRWILQIPFEECLSRQTYLQPCISKTELVVEIGPRLNFSTAFSTNAVSICHSVGLSSVTRVEMSRRYLIVFGDTTATGPRVPSGDEAIVTKDVEDALVAKLHDRMTECRYTSPITTFDLDIQPDDVYDVDIMGNGKEALEKANQELGLAFDEWDLNYYTDMFKQKLMRNPTSVECFDLAQSNSEHSRHWFFKGHLVVDGDDVDRSLFQMVTDTQKYSNPNNIIKFSDNSSGIEGFMTKQLYPQKPSSPSVFRELNDITRHIVFTAETHNFPTGVAPFPGATTGAGGRMRDVQSTGRGAHVIAGTAGYCFGNLHIPDYGLPWEDTSFVYPPNFARPLEIAIGASDGASDYGNKFGEPVLTGFARSFGLRLPNGERREWVKPIMFSGGIGALDHFHVTKETAQVGMDVVKVGGPVYRIGVGGGAASSIQVQGDNASDLDFGAVQRGDAEMEQKLNRVLRACIEMGEHNPICSIHDQGAGGNGNVLKEICDPAGAVIRVGAFQLADPTISVLELWGAEYQESDALLIRHEDAGIVTKMGRREKCPVSFVGAISGNGKIQLDDDRSTSDITDSAKRQKMQPRYPVDLDLELVLGSMPQKVFKLEHSTTPLAKVTLPESLSVTDALQRVLRLPAVASKRYLTNKVDRSVTGLVAQQQCVGPLHTPLADVAVVALSYFDTVGGATAVGEQPIKGLVDAGCGARMSVGEALTNLVWARITSLKDVKCSGNWMWAAKLPGEGALLVDACRAMCDVMQALGVAVDGGKDSLSMAARVGMETIKAPGSLVVSVYAGCPDITATVTPDLKCPAPSGGVLLYVPLCPGKHRLGGSALAQCYGQIGDFTPDLEDPALFCQAFNVTQGCIADGLLLAGHDVSDGGLIGCVLEMTFAGNCGINVDIPAASTASPLDVLFAEELGLVMEIKPSNEKTVLSRYEAQGVTCYVIGSSSQVVDSDAVVNISVNGSSMLNAKMTDLRDLWEETSFQLERRQCNTVCVEAEQQGLRHRRDPPFHLTFDPSVSDHVDRNGVTVPSTVSHCSLVAVIREEGSNGDREMVAAFHMAGFEVWDVNMHDLCSGAINLDKFRGIAFVGGFSYADVLGSAKGWAATLKFNPDVRAQFDSFYHRSDTFSLGVCNGCQLMALLGWVAPNSAEVTNGNNTENSSTANEQGVHLTHNASQRYESRFCSVKVEESSAVMLKGMAGSVLGIWVAHGEGRMVFRNSKISSQVISDGLAPLRYVDDSGHPTVAYPFNPNGTEGGIAALCSDNGRHLAMMPHPERCVLPWQWPWMPIAWQPTMGSRSPWITMFTNAYEWCQKEQI